MSNGQTFKISECPVFLQGPVGPHWLNVVILIKVHLQ